MSLLDTVRQAVKIADTQTKSLQATVSLQHVAGPPDGQGNQEYNAVVLMRAIVDWKQKQLRTVEGVLTVSRASVMFLDVAEVASATNGEGIDDHDIITLPDGTTGPILDMAGFIDAGTGQPIATEVFLG